MNTSNEIEKAVLGAILVGGGYESVKDLLTPEMFYDDRNASVFKTMGDLYDSGSVIDSLTVAQKNTNVSIAYISNLSANIGSSAHLKHHAAIVYEKFALREAVRLMQESQNSLDQGENVIDVLEGLHKKIETRIFEYLGVNTQGVSIFDAGVKSVEDYYVREKNVKNGIIPGIPTTFNQLNKLTGGLQPEQLIVLAGRPGMGKTSIAISFMLTSAKTGKSCAFFSLEMTSARLMDKVVCSISGVDHGKYKSGKLNAVERQSIESVLDEINKMKVVFNDEMLVNIEQIHSLCKSIKKRKGLDVVFIDYLQLMTTRDKNTNREREVSTMSRKAKMMAVDLNVPVVLLSQLNRNVEERNNKRPMLSDLRESGAIEQDADIVLFAYRDSMYNESPKDEAEIVVAKHREGGLGIIPIGCNESLTKFWDRETQTPF